MPRRTKPDPLAAKVGTRIRQLRQERGLTAEKLVFESEVGSKGYLSDVEAGRALPSLHVLERLATYLGVGLLDLVTFPDDDLRQRYVDQTRLFSTGALRKLLREAEATAPTEAGSPKRAAATTRSRARPQTARPPRGAAKGADGSDGTPRTAAPSTTRRRSHELPKRVPGGAGAGSRSVLENPDDLTGGREAVPVLQRPRQKPRVR